MPTLYEMDALHMATGADPNQLLIGEKRNPFLQEIHELTVNLTKGQINHIMKLNAAMVPVVEREIR